MPSNIFYDAIGVENLNIARTATATMNFRSSCVKIISTIMKEGSTISKIKRDLCIILG